MDFQFLKNHFLDYQRPNYYRVDFKAPFKFSLKNLSNIFSGGLSAICKSTSFPFFTFNTEDVFLNNKKNTVINKIDFDPVSFTFNVDAGKEILNFIFNWKDSIMNDKYQFGYKDDYTMDIDINLLTVNKNPYMTCTLKDAILLNVDPIALSYESKDTISEVTISVGYDDVEYN